MEFKDIREDFTSDVYNTLDFLPTNSEANRIIDSFDRVVEDAIVIPKGATNGDMIMAMFPDLVNSTLDLVDVLNNARSWWNAPYKRGDSDG